MEERNKEMTALKLKDERESENEQTLLFNNNNALILESLSPRRVIPTAICYIPRFHWISVEKSFHNL
jgi:hypothetical protein